LFSCAATRRSCMSKVECIFHYFNRLSEKEPTGTVTIHRQVFDKISGFPDWATSKKLFPPLRVYGDGVLEESSAIRHADFANEYIGGGVLRAGCVQEEILFVIKPECLVSLLLCEKMDTNEAVIITGAERYSGYSGYGSSFAWAGNFVDESDRAMFGQIAAIDAVVSSTPRLQFTRASVKRDLNKAYCGFVEKNRKAELSEHPTLLDAVATGNWGCGAFGGNKCLKFLQQLMAAAEAQREIHYYTFRDYKLAEEFRDIYRILLNNSVTVGDLFGILMQYQREEEMDVFEFVKTKVAPKSAAKQRR